MMNTDWEDRLEKLDAPRTIEDSKIVKKMLKEKNKEKK